MSWIPWNYLEYSSNRNFHSSAVRPEKGVANHSDVDLGSHELHAVPLRPIDKKIFVWSGKYKRIEDVPDRASRAAVAKAQSLCRIKTCNYMILGVIIAAGVYIALGKRDAEKGLTISKMNRDWHKEYNRKYEEKEKEKLNM